MSRVRAARAGRGASLLSVLLLLFVAACGGHRDSPLATIAPSAQPEASATAAEARCTGATSGCVTPPPADWLDGVSAGIAMGAPFVADASTLRLKAQDGDQAWLPVGAYGDLIIIEREPLFADRTTPQQFELWDPRTGDSRPLWQGETGKWDVVGESSGDWLATVRGGRGDGRQGAHAGQVILRNLQTGEVRPITISSEDVDLASGAPSMSGSLVAWSDSVRVGPFPVETRVHLYDIESGLMTTLADVHSGSSEAPPSEVVSSPSVAGRRVAWEHWAGNPRDAVIDILDLDSGAMRTVATAKLAGLALSADGAWLAWNEGETNELALNLETGEKLQFAHDSRFILRGDGSFSWTPAFDGGLAGVYDLDKREVRLVHSGEGVQTNIAGVMGSWFVWQEMNLPGGDGYYYFVPYQPGRGGQ